ncbi:hypothetical protein B0H10DRAFT_1944055 [Mycena sp. CBHHK59/15]|nr:hypothetical protein B0H10DRAFT_1944055 [Mycena sp. CBHHK59/15]
MNHQGVQKMGAKDRWPPAKKNKQKITLFQITPTSTQENSTVPHSGLRIPVRYGVPMCAIGDVQFGKGQTVVQTDTPRAARWSTASNDYHPQQDPQKLGSTSQQVPLACEMWGADACHEPARGARDMGLITAFGVVSHRKTPPYLRNRRVCRGAASREKVRRRHICWHAEGCHGTCKWRLGNIGFGLDSGMPAASLALLGYGYQSYRQSLGLGEDICRLFLLPQGSRISPIPERNPHSFYMVMSA